ncbi:outer membrane lipoprotein-sorting protein [Thalassococcus sp. CAU 1522]|uniref:Outer membrane lipoprotein-sorting protein n=1 Tax=Thalassococcus arenae TaxID=2851652 RepID=A0ABS6N3F9_9RHOB|nr:outer membrane lipoprotein-sorting protein [Thalassococcus arenae]MBV2358555.1 outer membrane lipoprotein-sorting protein [Thalassococcus arenae]
MSIDRRVFNTLLFGSVATAGLGFGALPALAANATAILSEADRIRNPQTTFAVDVKLVDYDRGKVKETTIVTVYARPQVSQFQTLVHMESPARDRGKIMLRNDNSLWLYDPASRASVRISPRQRLLGNASNGDVVSSNLVGDYSATLAGTEAVVDGDRKNRNCHKLTLTQTRSSAPYNSIEFWVDAANSQPVKGKYFTKSGKLIKVAWYRKLRNEMGALRPTEVVIADGFNPNSVTTMTMSNFRAKEIPASWFSKEWLPNFQAS